MPKLVCLATPPNYPFCELRSIKLNGFTECYQIGAKKLLLTELES